MAKRSADIDEKARAVARAELRTKSLEGHGPRVTIDAELSITESLGPSPPSKAPPVLAEIARDVAALAAVPVVAIWSADEETRTLTPSRWLARRREASRS